MTETKFTPGPWAVYRTTDGSAIIGIGDADAGGVTDSRFGLWRDGAEKEANAALIAAAPDLYAALEAARLHLINDLDEPGRTVFWKIVSAQQKARGES